MKSGYLRKNGVPYSANPPPRGGAGPAGGSLKVVNAVLTEYYNRTNEPNGDSWMVVTTMVDDPVNLYQQFVTSTHFKLEKDGSKWNPSMCEAK
jgi:hypothetical protein